MVNNIVKVANVFINCFGTFVKARSALNRMYGKHHFIAAWTQLVPFKSCCYYHMRTIVAYSI